MTRPGAIPALLFLGRYVRFETCRRNTLDVIPTQVGIQLEVVPQPPGGCFCTSGWAPTCVGVTSWVGGRDIWAKPKSQVARRQIVGASERHAVFRIEDVDRVRRDGKAQRIARADPEAAIDHGAEARANGLQILFFLDGAA